MPEYTQDKFASSHSYIIKTRLMNSQMFILPADSHIPEMDHWSAVSMATGLPVTPCNKAQLLSPILNMKEPTVLLRTFKASEARSVSRFGRHGLVFGPTYTINYVHTYIVSGWLCHCVMDIKVNAFHFKSNLKHNNVSYKWTSDESSTFTGNLSWL